MRLPQLLQPLRQLTPLHPPPPLPTPLQHKMPPLPLLLLSPLLTMPLLLQLLPLLLPRQHQLLRLLPLLRLLMQLLRLLLMVVVLVLSVVFGCEGRGVGMDVRNAAARQMREVASARAKGVECA